MKWNREFGILTFVTSFIKPQQNFVGRLMPSNDLRNPVYFVKKLNEALVEMVECYSNTYFCDLNDITATFGRKYANEDAVYAFNHGSLQFDYDFSQDQQRLEPVQRPSVVYQTETMDVRIAFLQEILAMYRSIKQIDTVKMVVVDLDDTLWRGVIADMDMNKVPSNEGWPIGFWETLLILKRRGILLGIISKNEESRVIECWNNITNNKIRIADFAIKKINWRPKSENMADLLAAVNLLPKNIVFIDDNPANRAEMTLAFPEMRVLGGTPSFWRHILLWAPETQSPVITDELASRTAMVQAQVEREVERKTLSNEEFLQTLDVRMSLFRIAGVKDPKFPRVIELINKTNQFNTTGKRWTFEECAEAFAHGVEFYAFELTDRFTDYGLVGVLVIGTNEIKQFVMSCRIMGLDAETAAIASVVNLLAERKIPEVFGKMVRTEKNLPCPGNFLATGFCCVRRSLATADFRARRSVRNISIRF